MNLAQPTLAAFDFEAFMGLMIPIIALFIPIVALLIKHQQAMAKIIHGTAREGEVEALRQQISHLQYQFMQQQAAIERLSSLNGSQTSPPVAAGTLQERLGTER